MYFLQKPFHCWPKNFSINDFFNFLFSQTFPIMHFSFSLFLDDVWPLVLIICFLNKNTISWEASTLTNSSLFWFKKWDHKSNTLNNFVHCIDKWRTPIWYGSSEAKDELKIANYECTGYPPQRKKEQTQKQVYVPCI